jgi:hypothetical protein
MDRSPLLVPKLLLGNEIVFQALLGYVLILSLTLILAKQSLGERGFPSRSLGTSNKFLMGITLTLMDS